MDINVTLFFQIIVFGLFVLFTMKYIWPPIMTNLNNRRTEIANGLADAEKGRRELELAERRFDELMAQAKTKAAGIIDKANQRSHLIIEEAHEKARAEGERIVNLANSQIEQNINRAKDELMGEVSGLVLRGAERVLMREIDPKSNQVLLDELASET